MSMQTLFSPNTIAVIGASSRTGTVGNDLVLNLTKTFQGKIIPINPKIDELYGLPVVHDISEVTDHIDLVIVAIPAAAVPAAIEQAAAKGATAAIVISAGFKEVGNVDLERQLADVCTRCNVTLIGPNCLGIINPQAHLNASFAGQMPKQGNVAFISQSGALCTAVLDYAAELGIGFSKFLSIGNKATVDEVTLLHYLADDPETQVIALYAESLTDAPRFIEAVQSLLHQPQAKPVIVLKSGKTAEGAGAIASHTGSLAGGDAAYQALFDQAGVIRADSVSELFELIQLFSIHAVQRMEHVAIITNAGGPGVLTTDALIEHGLKLASLSPETVHALQVSLPPAANTHNPVDILGDALADRYALALNVVARDPNVDGILLILTPQSMTQIPETAAHIVEIGKTIAKPIAVSFMGKGLVKAGITTLRTAGVVASEFPEPLAYSLGQMGRLDRIRQQSLQPSTRLTDVDYDRVKTLLDTYRSQHHLKLPEAEALEILEAYRFPTLKHVVVTSTEAARQIASTFSQPVVMKIVSADILHKSDVGGVRLSIQPDHIAEEYDSLVSHIAHTCPEAHIDGVLIVEMAPAGGTELILGVNKAPGLGSMIMVGLGGIFVEMLKDVRFGFVPMTPSVAMTMLDSLRSKALLEGARGSQPVDKQLVVECIMRLAQLVTDFPEISELDINPLLAHATQTLVLDARIVLSDN
jgi:acetyltransferase